MKQAMLDKLKFRLFVKSEQPKRPPQNNIKSSRNRLIIIIEVTVLIVAVCLYFLSKIDFKKITGSSITPKSKFTDILNKKVPTPSPVPTPVPTPSPTPSPRPLTFAEMDVLYGPCVRIPVLMYHHVQSREQATANKQTGLTVYTDIFKTQMEYLKTKGYNTATTSDLVNFFDNGIPVPPKSFMVTFDDGYQDFFTDAYPILNSLGFKSIMYLPTGLMQNPGYLGWGDIGSMTGSVYFGNHTWSHKNVVTQAAIMQKEISTANTQLLDHGLNSPKTFAYPYGPDSVAAENYLASLDYKLAFTTRPGNILCKKQRFDLPRIRIGNTPLSYYGF
jgi:peptidoglycan/xylan/chitin deacetylase (PgdA/CDA1 family)